VAAKKVVHAIAYTDYYDSCTRGIICQVFYSIGHLYKCFFITYAVKFIDYYYWPLICRHHVKDFEYIIRPSFLGDEFTGRSTVYLEIVKYMTPY